MVQLEQPKGTASTVPSLTPIDAPYCANPGCGEKRGHGLFGRFCVPHAEQLARFRDELEDSLEATKRWGAQGTIAGTQGRHVGSQRPRKTPVCCNPHCFSPRMPGHAFCDVCEDAGMVAEADMAEAA